MRKSTGILLGSIAVLSALSAPVLAKSSGAQKPDDKSAASACSAYEQAPTDPGRRCNAGRSAPAAGRIGKPSRRATTTPTSDHALRSRRQARVPLRCQTLVTAIQDYAGARLASGGCTVRSSAIVLPPDLRSCRCAMAFLLWD